MTTEKYKYHFLRYNENHVLRPNVLLLLILAFLCKDTILVLAIGAGSFKGGAGPGMSELANLFNPIMIISNLPAFAVVYSLLNRRPKSGSMIRFLWKYGRYLIALSIIFHIMLIFGQRGFQFTNLGLIEEILIGVDLLVAVYVFSSPFVKDIFADFPT